MERNFYNDDFERLIRQKADQYKMYPSDQVWKGVYKSLHGRKRWRWAGLAVFLLGIGIYTGNIYLSDKPADKVAQNIQPSLTATNQRSQPAMLNPSGSNNNSNNINNTGSLNPLQANSQGAGTESTNTDYANALLSRSGNPQNLLDAYQAINLYSNENTVVIENEPEDILGSGNTTRIPSVEKLSANLNDQVIPIEKAPTAETVEASSKAFSMADAASESVLRDNEKIQNVNWLQEYAVFQLSAAKPKRLGLQLHFSPTVNYRKLTGSSSFTSSEQKSIPLSPNIMGDVDQYVKHKPALGFEAGSNLVYRYSKRISFKAGVQFNYSRYNIEAYEGLPEIATIALNNNLLADTISTYSSIRNLSGYAREDLSNQYFQLSVPVGVEFRVLGSDSKLQLNIAGTIQPTYLLNRNSYLITTDYKNYMREPSLVRRWNVNGGLETYVSYFTGTVRWQVGPQFRYQLLSSYSHKYPIKEQLMEYGFKIGVTKTLK